MDRAKDATRLVVEPVFGPRIADFANDAPGYAFVINVRLGSDLAGDDDEAGR
jgi:hypothetical protein